MKFNSPFWRLWGAPIVLGIACLAGLLTALIGDGVWDVLSWVLLGLLVVVILYFSIRSPRSYQS